MLKMILDPMGGIQMTNDGNAILREIDGMWWYFVNYCFSRLCLVVIFRVSFIFLNTVSHPAAKSMIELSRTQDEEVGDGTTSVIILGVIILFI